MMNQIPAYDAKLNCAGLFCPMTIEMAKEEIENIGIGQILKVDADDPAAEEDISRWAKRASHEIVRIEMSGNIIAVWIKKNK